MVFNSPQHNNNLGSNLEQAKFIIARKLNDSKQHNSNLGINSRKTILNAPMIESVHKVKPGCSACGKKVA